MSLLGPVFWYDLTRIARKQRIALGRGLYGLALLGALMLAYGTTFSFQCWADLVIGQSLPGGQVSRFAETFFWTFMALQFAVVILFTPAWVTSALAEERSKNTLTFLLTSRLTSREIVFGKLLTRLLQLGLLVATGLPILALVQFMGGVDPLLPLTGFAALALTALSLSGVSILCALYVRKPENAAWRAYQVVMAYIILCGATMWAFDLPIAKRATMLWRWVTPSDEQAGELVNAGNPFYAFVEYSMSSPTAQSQQDLLLGLLLKYAVFHGLVAFVCIEIAWLRLRAVAARQVSGLVPKKARVLKPAPHPPVWRRAVLWKEVYCESRPRQRWLRLFFGRWFFTVSFIPLFFIFLAMVEQSFQSLWLWVFNFIRYGGTMVVMFVMVRVAVHAARSVSGERDRGTLDPLLTTDLTPREIIRDKWWGSFLTGRWVLLWLIALWCMGVMALAVHPLALGFLVVETMALAAFAASVGLYFSVRRPTGRQAAMTTLIALLLITTIVPFSAGKVMGLFIDPDPQVIRGQMMSTWGLGGTSYVGYSYSVEYTPKWSQVLSRGWTAPWLLGASVKPWDENLPYLRFYRAESERGLEWVAASAAIGVTSYLVATFLFYLAARERFLRNLKGTPPDARPSRRIAPSANGEVEAAPLMSSIIAPGKEPPKSIPSPLMGEG